MKFKTIFLILIVLGFNSSAQDFPVKYTIKTGVAFPNMAATMDDASSRYNARVTYYVGGNITFPMGEVFSFQPGLTFIQKGTSVDSKYFTNNDPALTGKPMKLNFSYIEMPLNFIVDMEIDKKSKIFYGAGPYYAFAVNGRAKIGDLKEKIEFGSADNDYKRNDIGLNFLLGFVFGNGFQLDAGYGLGFSGVVSSGGSMPVKVKNRVFRAGIGYSF